MTVAEIGATKVTSDRLVAPTCGRIEYITMKVTEVSPIPTTSSAASAVASGAAGMPSMATANGAIARQPPVIAHAVRTTGSMPRKRRAKFSAIA